MNRFTLILAIFLSLIHKMALADESIKKITESVESVCQHPSKKGKYWNVKTDIDGSLIKLKIIGLGASASIDFSKGEWEGVQQVLKNQQLSDNVSYRNCVSEIMPLLLKKYTDDDTAKNSRDMNLKSRALMEQSRKKYVYNSVNVSDVSIDYSKCKESKNEHFHNAVRGFVLINSYYYLTRSYYNYGNFDHFGYARYDDKKITPTQMIKDIPIDSIFSFIKNSTGEYGKPIINNMDSIYIDSFISELIEYKEKFDEAIETDILLKLDGVRYIRTSDLYEAGLSSHSDPCFSESLHIENIKIAGLRDSTYFQDVNLEQYFYTFWYRRYKEGSQERFYNLAKFVHYYIQRI